MFSVSGTRILLTAGDTGILTIKAKKTDHVWTDADAAVFTIRRQGGGIVRESLITPDGDGTVQIAFTSDLTDEMKAGTYEWDIRYCVDAVKDAGRVVDAREVITPMRPGIFELIKAVGRV